MRSLDEWLRLRARFRHDWLENRFLTFLYAEESRLAAAPSDRETMLARVNEWCEQRNTLLDILESAEDALSPAQLLDAPPLDAIPTPRASALRSLIHRDFQERSNVSKAVDEARARLRDVDDVVAALHNGDVAELLPQLREAVTDLDAAVSRIPTRILL